MSAVPKPTPRPPTAAERLAELRRRVEAAPGGRARRSAIPSSLRLSHTLSVLCARAVRVAARTWPRGRDPRSDRPTYERPWQVVWQRWMTAAENYRALAKWHVAAKPWRDDLTRRA